MSESVPLKPVGKEEIRRLELALLFTAFSSDEFRRLLIEERQHLTWIDSLFIAAAALARERAGVPTSKMAEELGVTEDTIRRHLRGETKAGQIVKEAYERLAKEGFKLAIQPTEGDLKARVEKARALLEEAIKLLQV